MQDMCMGFSVTIISADLRFVYFVLFVLVTI